MRNVLPQIKTKFIFFDAVKMQKPKSFQGHKGFETAAKIKLALSDLNGQFQFSLSWLCDA
jgi:hypothetical protein